MGYCSSCGHALGVGRFCTNCGHPVDAPAPAEPSAARYPLLADEVASEPEPVELAPDPTQHRSPRAWWPWVAVLVALTLVVVLVWVALDWATGEGGGEVAGDATVAVPETAPPNQDTSGNRRILAVEWVFDDGTTVEQDLTEARDLQTVDVDVTTTTVVVRLVTVSEPGTGPSSRDFTAISELSLVRGR